MLNAGRRRGLVLAFVVTVAVGAAAAPVLAERGRAAHKADKAAVPLPPAAPPPATPAPPPDSRPYDPQLMRLGEILGALTYLGGLCGEKDADQWRARMQALLDAEGSTPARKDRLAGAYNEGLRGYQVSYRTCTANAHLVIQRFLAEGARIARDVENRYRAS